MIRHTGHSGAKLVALLAMCMMTSACGGCGGENNENNNENNNNEPCVGDDCEQVVSAGIVVGAEAARSCEVLIEEGASKLSAITFADGTTGAMRKQAPKVAVTFARDDDSVFAGDFAPLSVVGEIRGLTVSRATGFRSSRAVLAGPGPPPRWTSATE